MSVHGVARPLVLAAALAAGCTDTNITAPVAAGGGILFASDRQDANFELYRVGAAGGPVERLTTDLAHNDFAPALSADGGRIAWEREIATPTGLAEVELWVMDADGANARAVVDNGSENRSPSWTPDGGALVYASFVTGNWEIFRIDLATGETVNLTESPFADQAPRVARDGASILFHTNRDIQFEVYAMDADGGDARNLSRSEADDRYPVPTPDGGVVWSRFTDSFDLWIMDGDGNGQRAITWTDYEELSPSVSPDGTEVVYQTNRLPPQGLEIVPIGGGAPRAVLTDAGSGSSLHPFWGSAP